MYVGESRSRDLTLKFKKNIRIKKSAWILKESDTC